MCCFPPWFLHAGVPWLSSTDLRLGQLTLPVPASKLTPTKRFALLLDLSSETFKTIDLLLQEHFMGCAQVANDGMTDLQHAFTRKLSSHAVLNLTSGCAPMATPVNMWLSVLMTLHLLLRIHQPLSRPHRRPATSPSRAQDHWLTILVPTLNMTQMVHCACPQRNTSSAWWPTVNASLVRSPTPM